MSAIGSVIVMAGLFLLEWFHRRCACLLTPRDLTRSRSIWSSVVRPVREANTSKLASMPAKPAPQKSRGAKRLPCPSRSDLPAGLGHAGQLALVCHVAEADPAESELAVDRLGATAPLAAGVGPHTELRLPGLLDPQRCLCHVLFLNSSAVS